MQQPQGAMPPLEDLKRDALRHYEELATKYNHWNSLIPKAIEAYDPSVKTPRWIKASKWPTKLTGERIGKTNYKRHVLVTILKNCTADWRNREYEDEKVEFILLESAEDLSAPASPVEETTMPEDIQQWIKREMAEYSDNENYQISFYDGFEATYKKLTEKPSPVIEIGERPKLNIALFSKLSAERAETGFKTYKNVPITYWTTALAGEVGELCNMIKKMERVAHAGIDGGSSYTAASLNKTDLAEEIGGIFIYLNLLSGLLDIDMEEAVIETFNSKSIKYGFAQMYPPPPHPAPAPIVGEREEQWGNTEKEIRPEHGKWMLVGSGTNASYPPIPEGKRNIMAWAKDRNGREVYAPFTGTEGGMVLWNNLYQYWFKEAPAPTEQAIPEEGFSTSISPRY